MSNDTVDVAHDKPARKITGLSATQLKDVLAYGLLLVVVYLALWLAISNGFNYGEPVWCVAVIWAAAHLGGIIFTAVHLPPLLGMLLSGMLLLNALPGLIAGLPAEWKEQIRAVALGTIFLRSGLELDLEIFKRVGPAAVRLLLIPGLIEAFVSGSVGHAIFDMPLFLGFTMGFILKAVGPAIVIQTMFEVQQAGLGTAKGIPSIVVGAASFDDMVAITGYSLFSSLALNTKKPLWETIMHGPIDLVLGAAAGCIGAMFCSLTTVWDTKLKRVCVVFSTTMVLLFTLYHYHYTGGGALSALVLGMLLTVFWQRGIHFFGVRGFLSTGPSKDHTPEVEHVISTFWRFFAQPLLFGIIGTMINFKTLDPTIIPKSLGVVVVGMLVRMPSTFTCMLGAGLTWQERLFIVFSWTPKATVQAALGAQPLDIIRKSKAFGGKDDPEYKQMVQHGEEILTTAVFAVLVCAPLGVMLIHSFARKLLQKEPSPGHVSHHEVKPGEDTEEHVRTVHASSFSQAAMRIASNARMPSVASFLDVRGVVQSYIHGNESGWALDPVESANIEESSSSRWHNNPAALPVASKDPPSPHKGKTVTFGSQNSLPDAGRPVAESTLEMNHLYGSQPNVEQYLVSIETLAVALDTPHITASAPEYGARLRSAVNSLRKHLSEETSVVHMDQRAVTSARQFFLMSQAAQTLPEIDAALEKLQVEVLKC